MPLLYQKHIYRHHVKANPSVLFVFGDNVARAGYGGQASDMRGEPNTVGVATKWAPRRDKSAYFTDADYEKIVEIMRRDLTPVHEALVRNKIVVWPMDGIGVGLSKLPENAPKIWRLLEDTRRLFETL